MTLWISILFFLPLFFVINLVAAVPGRDDLRAAMRVGTRHFVSLTLIMAVICAVLTFAMDWMISSSPLW